MKKFICIFLMIAMLLPVVGCGQVDGPPEKEDWVLPPTRVGTAGESYGKLAKKYTFGSAFAEAEVVARVVVGDWIGDNGFLTYFEATVLECYKGEIEDSIVLLQDGHAESTMEGYPLFTGGNELFVFLNDAESDDYGHAYWIIGSHTTFLDVGYDSDGNRYFADRYGHLGVTVSGCSDYSGRGASKEVCSYIAENDSVLANCQYQYIFSEEDIQSWCEKLGS